MPEKRKSSFNLEYHKVLDSNEGKGFNRVKLSDIETELDKTFEEGREMGDSCGIKTLDKIFRLRKAGGFYLFTGYEASGKSEILKFLAKNGAELYNYKCAIFSPEEETDRIFEDLARTYLGKSVSKIFKNQCTEQEWEKAKKWVNDHFTILEFDGMVGFETLLAEYERLAEDEGVKWFVTDPWNYIAEGAFDQGGIKYLKVALSHMKTFSRRHKVHNFVVEHQNNPKPNNKGEIPKASKFNITGGSMWRNKVDSMVIMHSHWTVENKDTRIDFEVAKSKDEMYNGVKGVESLWFEIATGRYIETDPTAIPQTGKLDFNLTVHEKNHSDEEEPF